MLSNELNSLNPQERELALQILKEMSEKGSSQIYEDLKYAEYREIPVDIETFLTDDRYLGQAWKDASGKSKLYPEWLKVLKDIFPNNLDTNYNTLLETGARGLGKMNPLDTPILTEHGYINMGNVKVGTKIYGSDGNLHNVIDIFPHGMQDIYEVKFSDGYTSRCGLEHLWQVTDHHNFVKHKYQPPETKVVDTKYLLSHSLKPGGQNRFSIPICKPIKFHKQEVFIEPYVMGLLIGDGCLRQQPALTTVDSEIADYFTQSVLNNNHNIKISNNGSKANSYYISNGNSRNLYSKELASLRLKNTSSQTKFIPKIYLYNDVESRIALLQGLLDTDGTANKSSRRCDGTYNYNINFSTVSPQLKDDIIWLVQSLGGIATYKEKKSYWYKPGGERKECKPHFRISIQLPSNIQPFRLKRKADLYNSCSHREPSRYIVSIEKLPEQKECQCIMVDAKDHLYMTEHFILTHNSEVACGCVGAYLMYRVMCLKDPLEFYKLKQTEKICFAFMNIKLSLAEEIAISKFQKTIQMSPWFMNKGRMTSFHGNPYWVPPEPIQIIIGSQSDDVIGQPIYFAFFDEISFIRNQDIDKQKKKAKDMIDTAIGGMFTRFIHNGKNPTMLVVASSKRSEQSFMEEYIKTLSETDGNNTYVVDKPVWEVKPKGTYSDKIFYVGLGNKYLENMVIPDEDFNNLTPYKERGYKIIEVPIDFKAKFLEDIDRNLCDFAGISSASSNKYMSAQIIMDCIRSEYKNPLPDVLEIGNGKEDTAQYYNFFKMENIPKDLMYKPLYIHLDMSLTGDMTGIAGVWIAGKKVSTDNNQAKDLRFRLAFSTSIKAPKGRQISFEKNRNFVRWLKQVGFNIKGITCDTYQSYDLIQQLSAEGFNCDILSVDRVQDGICKPYQYLRSSFYEQRFEMYKSDRLFDECVDIERNIETGKVDHSPNFHKDVLDAVCGATYNASKNAEQYAFEYGEDIETTIEVSSGSTSFDRKQINIDFENELKKMFSSDIEKNIEQNQDHFKDFGMGKATSNYNSNYVANGIIVW